MRAGRCGRWVGLVYPKGKTAGRRVLRRGVVWMIWRRETGRRGPGHLARAQRGGRGCRPANARGQEKPER